MTDRELFDWLVERVARPVQEWRTIADFPAYEVSEWGWVRRRIAAYYRGTTKVQSPVGKVLRPAVYGGYYHVQLGDGHGVRTIRGVHRLVCEAFHGPCPGPGYEPAHDDGNGYNNHTENLAWKTRPANNRDRVRHGTMAGRAKLTVEQVREIRRLGAGGAAHKLVARQFGVSHHAIRNILYRRAWAWLT
jgi:hypothetical protein